MFGRWSTGSALFSLPNFIHFSLRGYVISTANPSLNQAGFRLTSIQGLKFPLTLPENSNQLMFDSVIAFSSITNMSCNLSSECSYVYYNIVLKDGCMILFSIAIITNYQKFGDLNSTDLLFYSLSGLKGRCRLLPSGSSGVESNSLPLPPFFNLLEVVCIPQVVVPFSIFKGATLHLINSFSLGTILSTAWKDSLLLNTHVRRLGPLG